MTTQTKDPYYAMIDEWEKAAAELQRWKAIEMDLRNKLFTGAFPEPKEGANNFLMADGRTVSGTHRINRSIDEAVLPQVFQEMRDAGDNNPERVVVYKPALAMKEFRALNPQMAKIFSQAVVAEPGAPALEIKAARAKGRGRK